MPSKFFFTTTTTSQPKNFCWLTLKLSRTKRFNLLRITASFTLCLAMVTPKRGFVNKLGQIKTEKKDVFFIQRALLKKLSNSDLLVILLAFDRVQRIIVQLGYALSFLRPLRRLLLITRRPALVFILALKPCTFFLRLLFG